MVPKGLSREQVIWGLLADPLGPATVPVCVRLCRSSWLRLAKALTQEEQLKTRGFWELGDGPGWCSFSCSCRQIQKK